MKVVIEFAIVRFQASIKPIGSSHDVSFSSLHETCHQKVQYRKPGIGGWCAHCNAEVPVQEIMQGVKVGKDSYVPLNRRDVAIDESEIGKVTVDKFVPVNHVPLLQREKAYMLTPEKGAGKPYQLLIEAMKQNKRIGIGTWQTSLKIHLICVEPVGSNLVLTQLFYTDEVRPLPEVTPIPVTAADRKLAKDFVEALSGDKPLAEYKDKTDEKIQAMLEARRSGLPLPKPAAAVIAIDEWVKGMQQIVLEHGKKKPKK